MYRKQKIVICIIILAFFIRLIAINQYFTGDEIDTVGPARSFVLLGDFKVYDTSDGAYYNFTHPPIRTLLYSYWAGIFGFSNMALRLIPIIFGTLFVLVVYFIGKNLYTENIGIIAAFMAAISRYILWFSDTASVDTGHFLFTTSTVFLFFIIYLKNGKKENFLVSSLFLTISILTKFSTLIIFIPILVILCLYLTLFT